MDRFCRFYGLTLSSITNQYGIVFQYFEDGSLRDYLKNRELTWQEKVDILYYVIQDLAIVHKAGLYHGLVTTRDILMNGNWAYLSGLDFSKEINMMEITENQKIFGVLAFMAPEVLRYKPHTQSADIYSIGIVMSEIASGAIPFHDRQHINKYM